MRPIDHVIEMEDRYWHDIHMALGSGREYRGEFDVTYRKLGIPAVKVYKSDVVEAVNKVDSEEGVAVLNFASYNNPGGGFMRGCMAQEEALCWSGTLYNVLQKYEDTYYARNTAKKNRGLYTDTALFNQWVWVGKKRVSVITCAAPNKSLLYRYGSFSEEQNSAALKSRVKYVLDVAEDRNVDVLFLGAWGCGVFKQNPHEVAGLFKKYLETGKYGFREVHFPITKEEEYRVFKNEFSNLRGNEN